MKTIALIFILVVSSYATSVDCTQIFKSRKGELLLEVEKIDDARQSFEALKAATNALFDKQRASVKQDRADLLQKQKDLNITKNKIKNLIAKNQKMIDEIKGLKSGKISQTYSKMKDSAAATIFENLPIEEASSILFMLKAKKISQILAKMDPAKASKITTRLTIGPPFNTKKAKK